ncbi:hypothetical protein Gotur_030120 [Gossypium turneri]
MSQHCTSLLRNKPLKWNVLFCFFFFAKEDIVYRDVDLPVHGEVHQWLKGKDILPSPCDGPMPKSESSEDFHRTISKANKE